MVVRCKASHHRLKGGMCILCVLLHPTVLPLELKLVHPRAQLVGVCHNAFRCVLSVAILYYLFRVLCRPIDKARVVFTVEKAMETADVVVDFGNYAVTCTRSANAMTSAEERTSAEFKREQACLHEGCRTESKVADGALNAYAPTPSPTRPV